MGRYRLTLLLFAALSALTALGGFDWLDNALMELRFRAIQRDASKQLVLVEIDRRSLRALDTWPWPRSHHAELVDRLNEAGAQSIALDIDLSSRSTPEDDLAFEHALARAGKRVILPLFKQRAGARDAPTLTAVTRPLDRFLQHVTAASVVVQPDADSRVRAMAAMQPIGDEMLPTIPALLGAAGRPAPQRFHVDFGIRAETIPRLSYADVMRGEFPAEMIKGRDVLVGATAVELGDQLSMPIHVTAPGVVFLSLATESLLQDRALLRTGPYPALLLALVLMALALPRFRAWPWNLSLAVASGATVLLLAMPVVVQKFAPVSIDTAPVLLAVWLAYAASLVSVIRTQTIRLFRQRLEVQQHSLMMRQIVENSFDAIVVVGWDGRVMLHNDAAERLFARDRHDLDGKPLDVLFKTNSEDSAQSLAALIDAEDLSARLLNGFAVNARGHEIPVEMSISRMVIHATNRPLERRIAARSYHFISARDVTERAQAESARNAALQEAQAASRAKSEFLATISHELRTPLNAIIGFSEMIRDEVLGQVGNKQYCGYAADIQSSGQHLLQVVNDILDVTRVEAGEMKLDESRVRLGECAESAMRLLAGQLAKKPIEVTIAIAPAFPALVGDSRLIKQVLVNVISNAIKFTPAEGKITVAAGLRGDGGISLSVADTGIGIPADQVEKLGRPFYQVDQSHTRRFGGIGLGLSIARGISQLHGASLEIKSRLGVGTVVTCNFPPKRTGPSEAAAA